MFGQNQKTMNQNQVIGNNLKMYREKFGLTQEILAEYLGINREEISYYENGKRIAPTQVLSEAAKLFGIDEFDFFETDMESSGIKVALAFRADTLGVEDLRQIADFRKIVLNYLKMKQTLADEHPDT